LFLIAKKWVKNYWTFFLQTRRSTHFYSIVLITSLSRPSSCRICSSYVSSRSKAFSSESSRDLRLFPTTRSSSSSSTILLKFAKKCFVCDIFKNECKCAKKSVKKSVGENEKKSYVKDSIKICKTNFSPASARSSARSRSASTMANLRAT
jgi:hypothetical protein